MSYAGWPTQTLTATAVSFKYFMGLIRDGYVGVLDTGPDQELPEIFERARPNM